MDINVFFHKKNLALKIFQRLFLFLLTFFIFVSTCFAVDLLQAYQDALENDPIFKRALSARLSQEEVRPQAIADLLPTIAGSVLVERTNKKK